MDYEEPNEKSDGLLAYEKNGGRRRAGFAHTRAWDYCRLVAVVFAFSFLVQGLLIVSLSQVTSLGALIRAPQHVVPTAFSSPIDSKIAEPQNHSNDSEPTACPEPTVPEPTIPPRKKEDDVPQSQVPADCNCEEQKQEAPLIRSLMPIGVGLYPFVRFSTYRVSLKTFFVLGLTTQVIRDFDRPVYTCHWQQFDWEPLNVTEAEMLYVKWDEMGMPYVATIVNCTFPENVGEDGRGGRLRLEVSVKPKVDSGARESVIQEVHEEKPEEIETFKVNSQKPDKPDNFTYKYAFCGPPIFGQVKVDWISSWLTYHYQMYGGKDGKVHFFLYNVGGMSEESKTILEPFLKAGVVEIVNIFDEWLYPAHYRQQILYINDCLQRTRFIARWSFFHDFDEFLEILPPNTLESLLEEHEDKPYLTFASLPSSHEHCTPLSNSSVSGQELWPVERMRWMRYEPECTNRTDPEPWICIGPPGRRKYVVNPRKVIASGVHVMTIVAAPPDWTVPDPTGVDLNGTIARVRHYQGALKDGLCTNTIEDPNSEVWGWRYDETIAMAVATSRELVAPLLPT